MSERPIAGRIWACRLRVTASITDEQNIDFVSTIVQEAIYFEFGDGHPEHDDTVDLTVGLCDDPVLEDGRVAILFPALVTITDPELVVNGALSLVAEMVQDAIDGWYERPKWFGVSFEAIDECREGLR